MNKMRKVWTILFLLCASGAYAQSDTPRQPERITQGAFTYADKTIPTVSGTLSFTAANPDSFSQFLDANLGKVVFVDINFDFDFALIEQEIVEQKCNPDNKIWDQGLAGAPIYLPLGEPDAPAGDITCAEQAFMLSGREFSSISGGPGLNRYDITGFYRVTLGSGKWPAIELQALTASADMWSAAVN